MDSLERHILEHIADDRAAFARLDERLGTLQVEVKELRSDVKELLAIRAKVVALATLASAVIGLVTQAIVWLVGPR